MRRWLESHFSSFSHQVLMARELNDSRGHDKDFFHQGSDKEQNHLAIKDGGEFEERRYFGEVL